MRLFNAARNDEYAQIVAACDDLMGTVGSWAVTCRPSLADLAQADKELARLSRWLKNVRARDTLGAGQAGSAAAALAKCHDALDDLTGAYGEGG